MAALLIVELKADLQKLSGLTARRFAPLWKQALKGSVLEWHKKFARKHFQALAPHWYPEYARLKRKHKKKGFPESDLPLVVKGDLRKAILASQNIDRVSGTSNRARLTMLYGRPKGMTPAEMRVKALAEMARTRCDFKTAQSRVYAHAGYSPTVRRLFDLLIPATAANERRDMGEFLRKEITKRLRESGSKTTIAVTGA